jgi:hypothetical protein
VIAAQIGEAEAEVIGNLVDGMEVLQVGCYQGHDTASLACSAARVITIGQCPGLDHAGFSDQGAMWWTIQKFYGVVSRTLLLPGSAHMLLQTFVPGQFDVAVINMNTCPADDPSVLLALISAVASKVVVIPTGSTAWSTWAGAMADYGYGIEQCGRLWIFERIITPAVAESKEGA